MSSETDMTADRKSVSRGAGARLGWSMVALVLAIATFMQAVFAGAMLSGEAWARSAHTATAMVLAASTLAAGLAAIATLRRVREGAMLAWILLALAAAVILQLVVGKASVEGAGLMWVHVPLGVAVTCLAAFAVAAARRLGME